MCDLYIYIYITNQLQELFHLMAITVFWAIIVKGPPSRCVEKIVLDGLPHRISWDELTAKVSHHLNDY